MKSLIKSKKNTNVKEVAQCCAKISKNIMGCHD
jgi:hypothetical protein